MDSVHDVGGKHGLGPIVPEANEHRIPPWFVELGKDLPLPGSGIVGLDVRNALGKSTGIGGVLSPNEEQAPIRQNGGHVASLGGRRLVRVLLFAGARVEDDGI